MGKRVYKFCDISRKFSFFQKFINDTPDFAKMKRNTFTRWVQKYADFKGFEYNQDRTNGLRWFEITKTQAIVKTLENLEI